MAGYDRPGDALETKGLLRAMKEAREEGLVWENLSDDERRERFNTAYDAHFWESGQDPYVDD